jgi:hypothetical protein
MNGATAEDFRCHLWRFRSKQIDNIANEESLLSPDGRISLREVNKK